MDSPPPLLWARPPPPWDLLAARYPAAGSAFTIRPAASLDGRAPRHKGRGHERAHQSAHRIVQLKNATQNGARDPEVVQWTRHGDKHGGGWEEGSLGTRISRGTRCAMGFLRVRQRSKPVNGTAQLIVECNPRAHECDGRFADYNKIAGVFSQFGQFLAFVPFSRIG